MLVLDVIIVISPTPFEPRGSGNRSTAAAAGGGQAERRDIPLLAAGRRLERRRPFHQPAPQPTASPRSRAVPTSRLSAPHFDHSSCWSISLNSGLLCFFPLCGLPLFSSERALIPTSAGPRFTCLLTLRSLTSQMKSESLSHRGHLNNLAFK